MSSQHHTGSGNNIQAARDVLISVTPLKISSTLSSIINILGRSMLDNRGTDTLVLIDVEDKIEFNNIVKFKDIINEWKYLVGKLDALYSELEENGSNNTFYVLENIKLKYIKTKNKFCEGFSIDSHIEVVKKNADEIVSIVENELLNEIINSSNISETIEVVNLCLQVILIDAFMKCKILEEPKIYATT